MTLRKILFWTHLTAGVIAGAVILLMSFTGVLLAYERQIMDRAISSYRSEPGPGVERLSAQRLTEKVRDSEGRAPASVTWRSDPAAPVEFSMDRERTIYVNPYTGAVLGEGAKRLDAFFHTMTDLHRWLALEGGNRPIGRAVTGACNLAFLVIVITGPFIWWPKKWTWKTLRQITWFKGGLTGKARDFNWHNAIGAWCVVPMFFIVLTGVIMSYPWANDLLYRIAGDEPPRPAAGQRPGSDRRSAPSDLKLEELDRAAAQAERQVPEWRMITLRLPSSAKAPLVFTIDRSNGGRPEKRGQLTVDIATGEIVKWEPFSSNNLGRKLRLIARFLHTGEAGGFLGQTVAMISSAGVGMLVWTGISLALRRFWAWRKRSSERTQESAEEVVAEV